MQAPCQKCQDSGACSTTAASAADITGMNCDAPASTVTLPRRMPTFQAEDPKAMAQADKARKPRAFGLGCIGGCSPSANLIHSATAEAMKNSVTPLLPLAQRGVTVQYAAQSTAPARASP